MFVCECMCLLTFFLIIHPAYEVYRAYEVYTGYIVFAFSVYMFVCVSV